LTAGVRLIQLRAKHLASGPLLELADEMVSLCRQSDALLIVNDRADIAALARANGLHLGQDDVAPADARLVVGESAMIGLSTHDRAEVEAGLSEPVQYLAFGPVFSTSTKETGYEARGLDRLREAASITARAGVPIVAIGGLTRDRAAGVREAGADSLAVITDLLDAPDLAGLESRARAWLMAIG
jgi:thiamine-phosphate pyrophosphorylase